MEEEYVHSRQNREEAGVDPGEGTSHRIPGQRDCRKDEPVLRELACTTLESKCADVPCQPDVQYSDKGRESV